MNLVLETERLILRPFEVADAEALFEMDKNPEVHTYLWQKPCITIQEVYDYIEMVQKQYQERGIGRFSTILKDTGELIGWTGIKFVNDLVENGNTNFYDYGYRLNEKYWNKGYATEASITWLDYFFNKMELQQDQSRIMNAYTHSKNGASNHVLQKVGFHFMENYLDKDGVIWKWWQMENSGQ